MSITTTYEEFVNSRWYEKSDLAYVGLGLGGEAGEALDVIKKSMRPGNILDKEALKLELGDVLFYLTRITNDHLGLSLDELMQANMDKLNSRERMDKEARFRSIQESGR